MFVLKMVFYRLCITRSILSELEKAEKPKLWFVKWHCTLVTMRSVPWPCIQPMVWFVEWKLLIQVLLLQYLLGKKCLVEFLMSSAIRLTKSLQLNLKLNGVFIVTLPSLRSRTLKWKCLKRALRLLICLNHILRVVRQDCLVAQVSARPF